MKTLVLVLTLFGCSSVLASMLSTVRALNPKLVSDVALINADIAKESDVITLLGDNAVVPKESIAKAASAPRLAGLLVIQDANNGQYGTTDGGILVFLNNRSDLEGLAADYGLYVKHSFSAAPIGILSPVDITTSLSFLKPLRSDPRVVDAQIDANFYESEAK